MKKFISILIATIFVFSIASTYAWAEVSPEGDKTYKVTVDLGIGENEPTFSYVSEGDTIALKPNTESEYKTYKFVCWKITGEYEIISGSLTSETFVIRPLGDISVVQVLEEYYEDGKDQNDDKEDDKKPDKKPQGDKNDSETSPPTNDNVLFILGGMFFASLLATAVFRRLAK